MFALLLHVLIAIAAAPEVKEIGAGEYQVTFSFKPEGGSKTVHLAGEFNGWSKTAAPMTGPDAEGRFGLKLPLKNGRYEYKFVCDGVRWAADPDNPHPPGSYGNSVLFVGVSPKETRRSEAATTQTSEMAPPIEHPAEIAEGIKLAPGAADITGSEAAAAWFDHHPMPWFTENAASFVFYNAEADAVRLIIEGTRSRTGYDLSRNSDAGGMWAVSLERSLLGRGRGYYFEIKRGDDWQRVPDPHARTYTSRGGRPVGLVAQASDDRGRIELIPDFKPSTGGLLSRDLYIYLPPGYAKDAAPRYAVVYMHDGQNCWDDPNEPYGHGGWQVNVTADRLIREGKVPPFIVVGIANTSQRMTDYGPGRDVCDASDHAYIRFLKNDVKPMIDQRYRTQPDPANTAIMGSSMGGLISFQAALLHPDVFGVAGVMSPAFWFRDPKGQGYDALLSKAADSARGRVRIYLDSGTAGQGQDGVADTRRMGEALIAAGWKKGVDLMRFEDQGAEHNERAWRARVHRPLEFMFGK